METQKEDGDTKGKLNEEEEEILRCGEAFKIYKDATF